LEQHVNPATADIKISLKQADAAMVIARQAGSNRVELS
jgi:GGDEF domain-containing protein